MIINFTIPALFPSVNLQYGRKGHFTFLTEEAKAYKEIVAWEVKKVWKKGIIEEDVKIEIWYYFPNKRRRDIGNDKLTFDTLEGIIIRDDKQITDLILHKRFDTRNPRTEIEISF